MCKYGMQMVLEVEPYKTIRFSVDECDSIEEAEKELKDWLKRKPELTKKAMNQRVINTVLPDD